MRRTDSSFDARLHPARFDGLLSFTSQRDHQGASMSTRARKGLVLFAFCAASVANAGDGYVEAKQRGQEDATNPEYRAWYLQSARPVFSANFRPALNDCAGKLPPEALTGFGVVLVIGPMGEVAGLYWKSMNPLAACLDPTVRKIRFPDPPKAPFYFGLEAQLGTGT